MLLKVQNQYLIFLMNRLLYMNIGHFQNNTILHVHEQLNQIIGIYIFCYSYKRYTSISNSFLSILKDDKKAYSCYHYKADPLPPKCYCVPLRPLPHTFSRNTAPSPSHGGSKPWRTLHGTLQEQWISGYRPGAELVGE